MTAKGKREPELVSARTLRRAVTKIEAQNAGLHADIQALRREMHGRIDGSAQHVSAVNVALAASVAKAEGRVTESLALLTRTLFEGSPTIESKFDEVIERLSLLLQLALDAHVDSAIPPTVPRWTEDQRAAFFAGVRDRARDRLRETYALGAKTTA